MSRTPHASLYELIAAQLVQGSQVFANTLTFDCLYARYVDHSPAPRRGRNEFSDAIESFGELRQQVDALLEGSRSLLDRAGGMALTPFADERTYLESKFKLLMNRAGVLHDYVVGAAAMSPPDMTWAWRRLEVTDQHARDTVTQVAIDVIETLARLTGQRRRPSVIIDYRHFHENRNITQGEGNIYLTVPFWAISLPRIAAGMVAHECAHSFAKKLLRQEIEDDDTRFVYSLADTYELIKLSLPRNQIFSDSEAKTSIEKIVGELLSDVLAAEILGPAYIVNLAEGLIGSRMVQSDDGRRVDYASHGLRMRLLLRLHDAGCLAWSEPQPEFLLGQVRESIREYDRINREIIANRADPPVSEMRNDWIKFQDDLLNVLEPGIEDFAVRRMLDRGASSHLGGHTPSETISSARASRALRAYASIWQRVDAIASESSRLPQGQSQALLGKLESLAEVRSFILGPDPEAPRCSSGRAGEPPLKIGESWSLDWFWLRARPPHERQVAPPNFEQLGAWMRDFAPPSSQFGQGVRGMVGLVLGASDGFILRPFLRVRQDVRLDPNIHKRGLAAFVERRALVEIVGIDTAGASWTPGPWTDACFISEVLLRDDQTPAGFLHYIVTHGDETGLELKRAFMGTGWMSVVLLLQPKTDGWRSRPGYLGASATAPARSITSIVCSLSVTYDDGIDKSAFPWSHGHDEEPMRVQSLLRVRHAPDIFSMARDWPTGAPTSEPAHQSRGPTISIYPTFGPFDGIATFSLEQPAQLPHVAQWLYREIAEGRIIRSVTSLPAEVLR